MCAQVEGVDKTSYTLELRVTKNKRDFVSVGNEAEEQAQQVPVGLTGLRVPVGLTELRMTAE